MRLSPELDQYNKGVAAWVEQSKKAAAAVQRLQKAVATGSVRDLERLRQAARTAAELAAQRAAECGVFDFDAAAYLSGNGGFLEELIEAAERAGVRLAEREGVIFSYPVLVRPEPASAAVRIDKKLVGTLRPETLAATLKQAQSRDPKARPERFIESLLDAYELVRARRKLDAYIDLPLTRLYDVLTLLPSTDYTLLDFTRDLYFLDISGMTETRRGFRMSLPASTVSREKSARVLRFVTRDGYEKIYASIKFTPAAGDADEG
jgi:alpha-D-ribose 1-methylphosphonate 5-triphosphate synthase subunit PhnG